MKRYKESCGAEITVLLASFGVHRAGACLRRVLEGQNLRGAERKRREEKQKKTPATDSERRDCGKHKRLYAKYFRTE